MNDKTYWHVLGAGAMGTLITSTLKAHGIECQLLTHHREPQRRHWVGYQDTRELTALSLGGQRPGTISRLILATKAYAIVDALTSALPYLAQDPIVISCANGLGFERKCDALLRGGTLYRAIATDAALRIDSESVQHTGSGQTLVGGCTNAAPRWFTSSLTVLPNWSWCADIDAAARRKFAINCVINPLTAYHKCLNGELVENEVLAKELAALSLETQNAMAALGLWPTGAALLEEVTRVCQSTAANQSSMLQDRRAGRRTEIDFLNGHLAALARSAQFAVPRSEALLTALR
jgi:2-dehydropantoate 2-reductase